VLPILPSGNKSYRLGSGTPGFVWPLAPTAQVFQRQGGRHAASCGEVGLAFRIADRVIQTEDDYNRDVFNGDLGLIEKMDGPFGMMAVRVVIV
jgi:ATP-dependent exoDNAse (exonuclease V) alpha subunit